MLHSEKEIKDFVKLSDPYDLWSSMFGCGPEETDICEGQDSSASAALEAALETMSKKGLILSELGYPSSEELPNPQEALLDVIRKKILSGAVLVSGAKKCAAGAKPYTGVKSPPVDPPSIAVIGSFSESASLVRRILPGLPVGFLDFEEKDLRASSVRLLHTSGKPSCRIYLRPENQVKSFASILLHNTVASFLLQDTDFRDNVTLISNEIADLPVRSKILDAEEILRFNEIVKFSGNYIDQEQCSLDLALRRSPYRRTLLQRLIDRTAKFLKSEVERYGLQEEDRNVYSASFLDERQLGALLYRLLGDEDFFLPGLLTRELVSGVDILLPTIPKDWPHISIIPPNDISITEFCRMNGPVDATLSLWSGEDEIPSSVDMEPVFTLVPSSSFHVDQAIKKLEDHLEMRLSEHDDMED